MTKRVVQVGLADDMELVEQARSGDRDALGELFVRHCEPVRRLLVSVTGNLDELDDLVQDVFIQVHRSLPKFRGDSKFSTWLHQLTIYVAYNFLRKPRRRWIATEPDDFLDLQEPDMQTPQELWQNQKTFERVSEILDTIKPPKRVAFILHAVEGHSVNEVAQMVGAPVATVKSRIWFARRELRKKAKKDPYLSRFLDEGVLKSE